MPLLARFVRRVPGPRPTAAIYLALILTAGGLFAIALLVGQGDLRDPDIGRRLIELRATRAAAAFLAGAALAAAGAAVQTLFRNPLASPDILGATAGANLGGQLATLGLAATPATFAVAGLRPELMVPAGCLLGAAAALAILLAFARARGSGLTLILVGFTLSALFLALGGLATSAAQDSWDVGRAIVAFTLGGVGAATRRAVAAAAPLILAGGVALWLWGRALDLFLSGEEEAAALGARVPEIRRFVVLWIAVLTGVAVSLGGNAPFVGLLAPHALRPFVGVRQRALVPAAALAGGAFMIACDVASRLLPTRAEVPLGVVTGLVGAPIFLWLFVRRQAVEQHG